MTESSRVDDQCNEDGLYCKGMISVKSKCVNRVMIILMSKILVSEHQMKLSSQFNWVDQVMSFGIDFFPKPLTDIRF